MKPRTIVSITLLFAILWVIACLTLGQGQSTRNASTPPSLNIAYPSVTQTRN